jgi:aminobenzoyl-glutamate utilization protein B
MSIGEKGMLVAARVLAASTLELFSSPAVLAAARREFDARRARAKAPVSVIPDGQSAPVAIR